MRYEMLLASEAVEDLRALRANTRAVVRDAIEEHLRHEPPETSRRRVGRLRGLSRPQYRLCGEEVRVFHDVAEDTVAVLAIVAKDAAGEWLEPEGEGGEAGSAV